MMESDWLRAVLTQKPKDKSSRIEQRCNGPFINGFSHPPAETLISASPTRASRKRPQCSSIPYPIANRVSIASMLPASSDQCVRKIPVPALGWSANHGLYLFSGAYCVRGCVNRQRWVPVDE